MCAAEYHEEPGRSLDEQFVLVYFADVPKMPRGWAGHPHGAVWFCREHAYLGLERKSMTVDAAFAEIKVIYPHGLPPSGAAQA